MLKTLASLGIGYCVDKVLDKAVPTAGMKIGEKILTKVGVGAISLAVGNQIDGLLDKAEEAYVKTAAAVCGVNLIEPETQNEEEAI